MAVSDPLTSCWAVCSMDCRSFGFASFQPSAQSPLCARNWILLRASTYSTSRQNAGSVDGASPAKSPRHSNVIALVASSRYHPYSLGLPNLAMAPFSPIPPRHPIRVVLSSTAFLPFMSVRKAAALAIAQLGVAAFFISGITRSALGESAVWFVLAATLLAAFVRAIDIESWALLIPGGFVSRVTSAFGARAAGLAKAAALVERVLLGALACVVLGHYVAAVSATAIGGWRFTGYVRPEDLATLLAVSALGVLWLRTRIGRDIGRDRDGASRVDRRRDPHGRRSCGA